MRDSTECVLFLLLLFVPLLYGSVKVNAPAGQIQGLMATDGNYTMFLGIPYAQIDADNPFGPSKPRQKFKKTFQADDDSAICPQLNIYNNTIQGTLDCLRLNVYVPKTANSHNTLPVMVYILGGGFVRGIAGRYQYGPKYLVRHDVILVTLNHRYGVYGFLCLDVPEVPGNQGLKDQVIALKWIKDNIESFGGDPDQITIFGFSTGAGSVDFHFIYTDEKLFKQAILQSGSSLNTMISTPDKYAPIKLSQHLGMRTNSITKALSFLATVDPIKLIATVNELQMKFGVCVEKVFDGVTPFITETWINVKNPNVKGKNIMLGINEYEGAHYLKSEGNTRNTFYESLSKSFDFDSEYLREISDLVKRYYLGDKECEDVRLSVIDFYSDFQIVYPMQRSLKRYLNNEAQKIYYYMFSYIGGRNNGQMKFKFSFNGAVHGDEIGYLFDPVFITWKPTQEDQLIIDRITTLWTNFAKYGNPTPEKTDLLPVKWTPVSRDHHYYFKIDSNLTMKSSLFHKRMAFWDLFYKLNEKYEKGYVNKY